jgi:hypothetical protein
MTRPSQKHEEIHRVEQLQRVLAGRLPGTLEGADEPDVIVVDRAHRVGVEVTELHQRSEARRSPARQQESERAGIVCRAQALAAESGVPIVNVSVHFKDSPTIGKKDRDRIAISLVHVVTANIPELESSLSLELWRDGLDLPWVRAIRIYRTAVLICHHWWSSESGWVQMDFTHELQEAIDEKNIKHARYLQHCDECWLLVIASGGRPSGLFELSVETRTHVYRSAFAKTFFMEVFGEELVELSTTAA